MREIHLHSERCTLVLTSEQAELVEEFAEWVADPDNDGGEIIHRLRLPFIRLKFLRLLASDFVAWMFRGVVIETSRDHGEGTGEAAWRRAVRAVTGGRGNLPVASEQQAYDVMRTVLLELRSLLFESVSPDVDPSPAVLKKRWRSIVKACEETLSLGDCESIADEYRRNDERAKVDVLTKDA